MLVCVLGLLVAGGLWWLIVPHSKPAAISDAGAKALIVLEKGVASPPPVSAREIHTLRIAAPVPQSPQDKPSSAPPAAPTVVHHPRKPAAPAAVFNGRPRRKARTVRMLVTGYSPDARSCGDSADNITASGYSVWTNAMKMVAADTRLLPFGSVISVPGYDGGQPVPVLDRGGAIKGLRLDLLFPTHEAARRWGKKWLDVTVWEYADR